MRATLHQLIVVILTAATLSVGSACACDAGRARTVTRASSPPPCCRAKGDATAADHGRADHPRSTRCPHCGVGRAVVTADRGQPGAAAAVAAFPPTRLELPNAAAPVGLSRPAAARPRARPAPTLLALGCSLTV